jgi:hypothetical protein
MSFVHQIHVENTQISLFAQEEMTTTMTMSIGVLNLTPILCNQHHRQRLVCSSDPTAELTVGWMPRFADCCYMGMVRTIAQHMLSISPKEHRRESLGQATP